MLRLPEQSGLRIAVVGCGYWGSKHVRVLQAIDEVEEVVLVDSTESRLLSLARSYRTAPCSTALRPVLPGVDAVIVATPPSTHVAVALEAIHAGKHVLIEKPLAPTAAGARRLIAAAADAGVVLMVGHTFEYNPAVRKLRELVQGQQLGELFYVDSARLNLGLYQNDVNVIIDLAPHDISIINHVLGRAPVAAQAWASRHAHRRFEDVAYLRLFYDDFFDDRGLSANIHVSWLDPQKVRKMIVVGSKKMVVYDDVADDKIAIYDKGIDKKAVLGENMDFDHPRPPEFNYRSGDILLPQVKFVEPLRVEAEHFIECIKNKSTPLTGLAHARTVVSILEQAK